MKADLHRIVATLLVSFFSRTTFRVILAPECTGSHRLPLFATNCKSRVNNYCWVDAVVLENDAVKAVIEIEQSGIPKPATLSGKILPIALSRYLGLPGIGCVPLAAQTAFVQVVNAERIPQASKKLLQYANLERDIRSLLPMGPVHAYWLLAGMPEQSVPLTRRLSTVLQLISEAVNSQTPGSVTKDILKSFDAHVKESRDPAL
jgi:hypothetical protein